LLEPLGWMEPPEQVPQAPQVLVDHKDHKVPPVQALLARTELQVPPEQVPPALPDHKDRVVHREYLGSLVPLVPAA
jgi:hypothetical protein